MGDDWVVGGDRRTAAAERVYAAATDLVLREGFEALDIDALAAQVHCSRATIYRCAGGKAQIRDAILVRLSAGITDTVRDAVAGLDGPDRVVTAITVALDQIRTDPMRRLMLTSRNSSELGDLHSSPVLARVAAELAGIADTDPQAAQWIVRLVVSLAYWPAGDNRIEREMLRRFVAPAFA